MGTSAAANAASITQRCRRERRARWRRRAKRERRSDFAALSRGAALTRENPPWYKVARLGNRQQQRSLYGPSSRPLSWGDRTLKPKALPAKSLYVKVFRPC